MPASRLRSGRLSGCALAAAASLAALGASEEAVEAGALPVSMAKVATGWGPDDPVEIFYAEFLLAQWVLERAPWNAYHSALAFVNNRTQQKALFDYTPVNTSSVMNMVFPDVKMRSLWQGFLGDVEFTFRDEAKTEFFPYWPESYSSFVRVGRATGRVFNTFADWVERDFAPRHSAFQPVEVSAGDNTSTEDGKRTIVRSRMCHDFVTDALWVLHDNGASLKAEDIIFRDHIIMYASEVESVSEVMGTARYARKRLRYLRLISLFLESIKQQFTHARAALISIWRLGLPVFLHDQYEEYQVHLVPPFLNYCYLPLAIPPEVHNPLGSMKLCALGMEANMSNITLPQPWSQLLATEERLDRPEALVSLLAVAVVAALLGGQARTDAKAAKLSGAKED